MRVVQAQSSITEMIAHFGLGDATSVSTLRIEWPSGIVREYERVAADQFLTLMENQAPIADASASQLLYISPNGLNATATLKGWRSSDPDGDALQYYWLATPGSQPATLLASGVEAVVVLPVGIHPLELVVSDGVVSATNALTVEVITTRMAMVRLIEEAQTEWRRSQPLVATLSAALASLQRGNAIAAINQLLAFQNKVRAQVAPSDPALAATFIQMAQETIDALSGGGANPGGRPHGRLTASRHPANGHVQLRLAAEPGLIYILEASTNLVDWQKIGIAVDQGDGTFAFEDPNAAKFPNRFYRIVSPSPGVAGTKSLW